MSALRDHFWERPLADLSRAEWEALCDGCGQCCLHKAEDEETGAIYPTNVACKLLDIPSARCSDYANRRKHVPDCVQLTPKIVRTVDWLPRTCAYRLVEEGKDLPAWHHLICEDRQRIHDEGHSVRGRTVSEETVFEEDEIDWVIDWEGTEP